MRIAPILKSTVFALIVILSLIALWLVAVSPASILDAHVVYQGF
jgi:hypothetical protein